MPKKIRKRPAKGTGPAFPEGQFGCHAGLFGDFPVSRGVSVLPFCSSPPPGNALAPRIRIAFDRGRAADQLPRAVLRRTRPGIFLHRHGGDRICRFLPPRSRLLAYRAVVPPQREAGGPVPADPGCGPGADRRGRRGEDPVLGQRRPRAREGVPPGVDRYREPRWFGGQGEERRGGTRVPLGGPAALGRYPGRRVPSRGGGREDAFDRREMEAIAAMACRVGTALFSARRHELFVCAKKSYGDLFRSQRDGVVLVRGGTIVRANPAGVRILGYSSSEELLGNNPTVLFPDSGLSSIPSRLLRPVEKDRESVVITRMRRKDGSLFEGEIAATWIPRPLRGEGWEPEYTGPLGMLIFRDVTLRTQTLEELRNERDFSAKVLDVAGVLVLQVGPDGDILLFNRQCEEVTGYAAAAAIGRKMTDFLLSEAARDFHLRAFEQILAGQIPLALEYAILTKSGEERLVVWNYAAIPGPGGKVRSIVAAGTDVTERRRFERAVITMQKMEAVGTLAGGIAHDFNNILTGILGNLDLARKTLPPDSAAVKSIEESIQASERGARLIRQLLG